MIRWFIRKHQRRQTAFNCALACHNHALLLLSRHREANPTEEEKRRIQFWIRAGHRYARISVNQSPWHAVNFAID